MSNIFLVFIYLRKEISEGAAFSSLNLNLKFLNNSSIWFHNQLMYLKRWQSNFILNINKLWVSSMCEVYLIYSVIEANEWN